MGEGYGFRKIRRELGVTAFGINAIVLPPGYSTGVHYHDEQEETYFVHQGQVEFRFGDGTAHLLGPGGIVRVDAATHRGMRNVGQSEAIVVVAGGKDGYVGRDGQAVGTAPDGPPGRRPARAHPLPDATGCCRPRTRCCCCTASRAARATGTASSPRSAAGPRPIAFDRPGWDGAARRATSPATPRPHSRRLTSITVQRATVVGHSFGAAVAAWLAADHPARVGRWCWSRPRPTSPRCTRLIAGSSRRRRDAGERGGRGRAGAGPAAVPCGRSRGAGLDDHTCAPSGGCCVRRQRGGRS